MLGLSPSDFKPEQWTLKVWPDNWRAAMFFGDIGDGCWSLHPNGRPVGLRYESLREIRLAHGVRAAEWPDLFRQIQIIEAGALAEILKGS
ncbi:MAG: DUF1799 domain-containing protein [Pseudomonadota bacterium]